VIRIGELGTTLSATSNRNGVFPILLTYPQAVKDYSALDVRLKAFFASVQFWEVIEALYLWKQNVGF
jgi:hypothetical protein